MNREQILQDILSIQSNYLCLELATGVGKTKVALEWLDHNPAYSILVTIPRLVLIDNFKQEVIKWGKEYLLPKKLVFTTYKSLPKHDLSKYDIIVFDEAHHLSDRCISFIKNQKISKAILLSATITESKKIQLKEAFKGIVFYQISVPTAIKNEILPDPKIYLWQLPLGTTSYTETVKKKGTSVRTVRCKYEERLKYLSKYKTCNIIIYCTEAQKYKYLCDKVSWWKDRYYDTRNITDKNRWLQSSLTRLKWLSTKKTSYIKKLLDHIGKERVITFCSTIKHAEELSPNCISSKNKKAVETLRLFNEGKLNAITAVNMLNEGMNLYNCRISVWAVINASQIMQLQKIGRSLRHSNPLIIIPYYSETREEDIITELISNFSNNSIIKITNLNEIEL